MNYSTAIFLISDKARALLCTYECGENAKRTLFKTLDQTIGVDDYVVVPTDTRHKMTVVKVVEIDVEPDFDTAEDVAWVIGVVHREDYEVLKAQEGDAIAKIKAAEKRKKREELRAALIADAEADLKALPIYTVESGGAATDTDESL